MTEKNAQSVYHFTYADAVSKALHQHHRNAQPRRKKDVKLVFSIREKRPVVSQKQTFQQVKQKAQPQTEKGTAVVDLDAKVPNLDDIYQELVSRKGTEETGNILSSPSGLLKMPDGPFQGDSKTASQAQTQGLQAQGLQAQPTRMTASRVGFRPNDTDPKTNNKPKHNAKLPVIDAACD